MAKFLGDVRTLSADPRYMGVVFQGSMNSAIKQAKAAPDHGLPALGVEAAVAQYAGVSRNRIALLQHLNLLSRS